VSLARLKGRTDTFFSHSGQESTLPISHFLDFDVGGWSIFSIDYAKVTQSGAIHKCF